MGLIVHEMWYCDYKLYHISNDLKVVEEPLRIRDAYLGGRTNVINLKEEFSNETKGGYVDFCSLYLCSNNIYSSTAIMNACKMD